MISITIITNKKYADYLSELNEKYPQKTKVEVEPFEGRFKVCITSFMGGLEGLIFDMCEHGLSKNG